MNNNIACKWQYRTLLFEFQKDGLLGDKYIDDEDVEAQLNEQGTLGWELVNVAMIQEGLLAFCKRPIGSIAVKRQAHVQADETVARSAVKPPAAVEPEPVSAALLQQQEREHIQHLERKRRETMSAIDRDAIGGIKIS